MDVKSSELHTGTNNFLQTHIYSLFLFLFPFSRSLRFAPLPPNGVGGARSARCLSPAALRVPSLRFASFGGSPLPSVAPPVRAPPFLVAPRVLRGLVPPPLPPLLAAGCTSGDGRPLRCRPSPEAPPTAPPSPRGSFRGNAPALEPHMGATPAAAAKGAPPYGLPPCAPTPSRSPSPARWPRRRIAPPSACFWRFAP